MQTSYLSNFTLSDSDNIIWQNYVNSLETANTNVDIKYTDNYTFSRKLDLHGYTLNDAWIKFREFVTQHCACNTKTVIIITGKNGQIVREFPHWCERLGLVRSYLPLGNDYNHPGSFKLTLDTKTNNKA